MCVAEQKDTPKEPWQSHEAEPQHKGPVILRGQRHLTRRWQTQPVGRSGCLARCSSMISARRDVPKCSLWRIDGSTIFLRKWDSMGQLGPLYCQIQVKQNPRLQPASSRTYLLSIPLYLSRWDRRPVEAKCLNMH